MGFPWIFDSFKWLTVWQTMLLLLNAGVLIAYALPVERLPRWVDFVPAAAVVIAIANLIGGDMSDIAIVLYAVTAIVFLCTVRRLIKPGARWNKAVGRIVRVVLCLCGLAPLALGFIYAGEMRYNPVSDFSRIGYAEAFKKLNERIAVEYPFSDWKKLDWNALEAKFEPIFRQAEQDHNKEAYAMALRDYVFSIHDGHVALKNEDPNVMKQVIGGGFGIGVVRLDDGRVLVNLVLKDSPAERSGIKVGAEIVAWDGKDVKAALANTASPISRWATEQARLNNQERFLTRAPIGRSIQATFRNWGETDVREATLQAYDDQYKTLISADDGATVEGKVLNGGYGYIRIRRYPTELFGSESEQALKDALERFQRERIKGLVIDLRENPGGYDGLVAEMAGYFVKEKRFYEYTSYYNRYTGRFEINRSETRYIEPKQPYYGGKIAVLINSRTTSSGEGLPLALKGMPNVTLVGRTGTNGSFGMATSPIEIQMPEGYSVHLPDGRSLDANETIQGDSDSTGQGGIAPDLRIPFNEEAFEKKYLKGLDFELDFVIDALNRQG